MSATNRMSLPSGYQAGVAPMISNASKYVPNNGAIQAPYSPNAPGTQRVNILFSAAPANGSTLLIPDSNDNGLVRTFTFIYGGSPGVGNIPLVAGGGTAAQAATAAQVALAAQLNTWTASNPTAGRLVLDRTTPGLNATLSGTQATGVVSYSNYINGNALPAVAGKLCAVMPYFAP